MACNGRHDWFADDEDAPMFCAQCGVMDIDEAIEYGEL